MYWMLHLTGGPQRVNHAAVRVGDKIYSFGGYCSGSNYYEENPMDVYILNTVTLKWVVFFPSGHQAPFLRYGHTAVAYNNKVYIWGGRNDNFACNNLYCFDPVNLEWSWITTRGSTPGARDGHSACVIGDHMYIFGGFEDDEDRFSQDVYKLCLQTFTWSYVYTTGKPPSYRDFHSATAIGNRMYVFGGRGDQGAPQHSQRELYCNNIVYLDVVENKWVNPVTTGDVPIGRRSHSAFVYKGQIYIFGGFNSLKGVHFNDLHRFNPDTMVWQSLRPLGLPPSKRRRQSCVVCDTRMYLFGGTSPAQEDESQPDYSPDLESGLKDHDDLHIFEFEPSLRTFCLMAVIKHQLDVTYLPEVLKLELLTMTNKICRLPSNQG